MKQYIAKTQANIWITGDWNLIVTTCYESSKTGNEPFVVECNEIKRINAPWHLSMDKVLASELNQSQPKRGRPKLGVYSKEITLLPKHWEWLTIQQGGASAAIRKLIDEAMKKTPKSDQLLIKKQKLDHFLYSSLGDQPGFEQASRAIYQLNINEFTNAIAPWDIIVKSFILQKFKELEL